MSDILKNPYPNRVFVGRLPLDTCVEEVEAFFSKKGEVVSVDLKQGMELCYAFVEYRKPEEAQTAIKKLHSKLQNIK